VSEQAVARGARAQAFLELYPEALPQVYGFLLARCGDVTLAEDLTAETFMTGVRAIEDAAEPITVGWLIVVARRRLIDHWRRLEREQRSLRLVHESDEVDPWDEVTDVEAVRGALQRVAPHYRAALTLRYIDGLSVPEVAGLLERTVHATESLLVRARSALRDAYDEEGTR
jgi:RNA polymerase sigma-70 factor (ECF subfamily)